MNPLSNKPENEDPENKSLEAQPLLSTFSDSNSEDAKEDESHPRNKHRHARLILAVALGLITVAALLWLASFGFLFLHEALTVAGYQNAFWFILGAPAVMMLALAPVYPKIHRSSAKIYAWLANNWFGQQLGLSTHAGRWGLASRTIRTVAAISYGVLITLFCLDVATLAELMTPYLVTIAITWLGIAPGIVANNAKIEQLFDTELRLLNQVKGLLEKLENEIGSDEYKTIENELKVGTEIPHGMFTLEQKRPDLFTALFVRKIHDANSIIGSLLSFTRFVSTVILPLFCALSITVPPVFFAIVIGSSILSSLVTWYTNRSRLQAHQCMILDIQHDYWLVQGKLNNKSVINKVNNLSDEIIAQITPSSNPFIQASIEFHLKKALLEYQESIDEKDKKQLSDNLVELLKSVINPTGYTPTYLERIVNQDEHGVRHSLAQSYQQLFKRKHTTTDTTNELSEPRHTITNTTDGLFVLEDRMAQCIIKSKQKSDTDASFQKNYEAVSGEIHEKVEQISSKNLHLLTFGLVTAHHKKNPTDQIDAKKVVGSLCTDGFFKDGRLNQAEIKRKYPNKVSDPHGRTSLAPSITQLCAAHCA